MKRIIFFVFQILIIKLTFSQAKPVYKENICTDLMLINESEFQNNRQEFLLIDSLFNIEKKEGKIEIPFGETIMEFVDEDELSIHTVKGQFKSKHWILILEQDPNQDYYYLINTKNSKIDKLVGEPHIFGDRIVCEEGSYTDCPHFMEIWKIEGTNVKMETKFRLNDCDLFTIEEFYLNDDFLYLNQGNKFYKLKVE